MRTARYGWALTIALGLVACAATHSAGPGSDLAGPWHYPAAVRAAVTDDYHGMRVADPYRSLEALDAPATRRWVQSENALSRPVLNALPQRAALHRRLTALMHYQRYGLPVVEGGRYFYTYNDGQQNQSALYVTERLGARARLLLDPNRLSRDGTVALADFVPDPSGRYLAYALSDGGTDWKTWHVRAVRDARDLSDQIHFTKFTSVSWARDGSGFYYSRYPQRADRSGDDQRQAAIYFHRLGAPQSADRPIYAVTDHPTRVPYGTVTEDGRYLVITLEEGTLTNGVALLPLGAAATQVTGAARPLLYDFDARYDFIGGEGDQLYFQTTADAPRGRVIAVDARQPQHGAWSVPVPQAEDVLSAASFVGSEFFAQYLHDAHSLVRVFDRDGRERPAVALPGLGTVSGFDGHNGDTQTFFSYTDFVTPPRVLSLAIASGVSQPLWTPQFDVDLSVYISEQVFLPSRDGTRVPMFIVHRRGRARDGATPAMLYGYGGFDISLTPGFSPTALAWLEMGGIYAVVNLRGGGEYGEAWHLAGSGVHKQNGFDDFIAAAEFLVRERYTRPAKLAITGRSNGGLLIGAAITQRPDLFGAALPAVGVLDMLRYQTASANARQWSSDYGLSENVADFAALYAYSPYHNVHAGTCYPATLVTTADHDDRVVPWHSYKFAAALQAAQGCAHPVLIRVETRAGHGAGKPLWMQIDDFADQWAFAAQALGMSAGASVQH